jgi:D-serine deaminase-like pyridoxal phosphate-dependent protein
MLPRVTTVADLSTPALVVDTVAFARNLDTMTAALPGPKLRPHVKAHKCTELAREQQRRGHANFTCATPREMLGMARAGLGDDLLLANESVDLGRLRALAESGARITVAVDSEATVDAAAAAGIGEVLVDVNVFMPRCGCSPEDAPRIADRARAAGLEVRGVMGYEGHAVLIPDRAERAAKTAKAMKRLAEAAERVGGTVVSAGGTGTYDINDFATEIQAGSYALMDTAYGAVGLPFRQALSVLATVVSASPPSSEIQPPWVVADVGLKSLGMDHGNPAISGATVWFCSDEHTTFAPDEPRSVKVGDRVRVLPAHVDPTVAMHAGLHLVDGDTVVETWPVDLRGW